MGQSDFAIPDESGADWRSDMNDALQALLGLSNGSAAPGTTYPNQLWVDTAASRRLLKQRDNANSTWLTQALADGVPLEAQFLAGESSPPALSVDVNGGNVDWAGGILTVASQTVSLPASPSVNPRYDLLCLDTLAGTFSVIQGAEAASPADPLVTAKKLPIARVHRTVGQTAVTWDEIDDLRTLLRRRYAVACAAYRSSVQSIGTSTLTNILFDAEIFDTDSIHSTSSNTDRFVAPVAGVYRFHCFVRWAGNSTGERHLYAAITGSPIAGTRDSPGHAGVFTQAVSGEVEMAAGDYIGFPVWQTSGGNLNAGGTDLTTCQAGIWLVSTS